MTKVNRKKAKNEKELSVKERKLIKNILSGMPKTEAMRQAGYSEKTAMKTQSTVLGKSRILTPILQAYERAGITEARLSQVAQEGLQATKVISAMIISENGEGMKDAHSMTRDFIEVPDFMARHKYLDTAHKLRGDYPDEKVNVTHSVETHEERMKRLFGGQ